MIAEEHLLPADTSQQEIPSAAPALAEEFSILVVDDSEANRDALCRRLKRHGYHVTPAAGGAEALQLLGQRPFDLLLLDVMMPGVDGLEVLHRIRQTRPATELPVIMATARDDSADVVRALDLGASDYVTKPLDFEVVLARVRTQLTLRRAVQQVVDLEQRLSRRNAELEASNARMRRDLEAAARVQKAFLPHAIPAVAGLRFAWAYQPCEALGGDFLNICPVDTGRTVVYVLDVSGHGVTAALLSVTLSRLLSTAGDAGSLVVRDGLVPPAKVAQDLDRRFPWDEGTEQFFTILYGIVDRNERRFRYVSAGHPGVVQVRADGRARLHRASGLPIGLGGDYEEHVIALDGGDRLYLYSDGVTEARGEAGELFGSGRLLEALERGRAGTLGESTYGLLETVRVWCEGEPFQDDISVLAVELD